MASQIISIWPIKLSETREIFMGWGRFWWEFTYKTKTIYEANHQMTSLLRISVLHSKRHLSQHSGLVAHPRPFSLCLDDTLSRRGSRVARALWSSLWPAQILYYSLAVIKIIQHASRMAWHGFLNSSFHADIPIWSWTLGQRKNSLIKKKCSRWCLPADWSQCIQENPAFLTRPTSPGSLGRNLYTLHSNSQFTISGHQNQSH